MRGDSQFLYLQSTAQVGHDHNSPLIIPTTTSSSPNYPLHTDPPLSQKTNKVLLLLLLVCVISITLAAHNLVWVPSTTPAAALITTIEETQVLNFCVEGDGEFGAERWSLPEVCPVGYGYTVESTVVDGSALSLTAFLRLARMSPVYGPDIQLLILTARQVIFSVSSSFELRPCLVGGRGKVLEGN
ncbi:hypothetical protein Dimus_003606 [Dionaea muscipula]